MAGVAASVLCLCMAAAPVSLKGSDTMVGLAQRWAAAFKQAHPEQPVQVTGGGSGTGLAALENGSTELAMSSRAITPEERARLTRDGAELLRFEIARDGVSFFVNEENPLRALSPAQLEGVFSGDLTSWSQLGAEARPIVIYTRESTSGTASFLREALLRGAVFPPWAQPLPGTGSVVNAVARERWSIGFGGAGSAHGVRLLGLEVDGRVLHPDAQTVASGAWPFARTLFIFAKAPLSPGARAFLDFVRSEPGQALVRAAGFFPVP
jgi:phosphate transport system substrate-binding protein